MYIGAKHFFGLVILIAQWVAISAAFGQEAAPMKRDTQNIVILVPYLREPSRSIYLGGSALAYRGSLSSRYQIFNAGVHVGLQWRQKKRLSGSLDLMVGKVQSGGYLGGTLDPAITRNRQPNTYFSTTLIGLSYQQQLNLLNTSNLRWYLTGGVGLLRYTPEDDQGRQLADLQITRLGDESYSPVTIMLPVGMGLLYKLKNSMTVSIQAGWLNTRTHYLDNIGKLSPAFGREDGTDNVAYYRFAVGYPFQKSFRKKKP